MKIFQITLQIVSIIALFALIPVSAADHIPVSDEFTDGEKFVNSDPERSDSAEEPPAAMPASRTSSAKPFPAKAATSGKPSKPTLVAKSIVDKANKGFLSRILGFLKPTQKDLEDSFNDDVAMGISNGR